MMVIPIGTNETGTGFAPSNPCAVNVPRGSQSREFFEVFEAPRNLPCELLLWVND
jgi:hypothetical protein